MSNHVTIHGNYATLSDNLRQSRVFFRKDGTMGMISKNTEYKPRELFSGKMSVDMGYGVVLHLDNGKATIDNPRNMSVKIDVF
jgi:hypothetical protein